MTRPDRFTVFCLIAFIAAWFAVLSVQLQVPPSVTYSSDASEYSGAAVQLAHRFFYSMDGITPFIKREPGQSIWLAGVYAIFGDENRTAMFFMQALLLAIAVIVLSREVRRIIGERAAQIFIVIMLLFPSVLHVVFSANRELLALSLAMFGVAALFRLMRLYAWTDALLAGLAFGFLLITYAPFILLPLWIAPVLLFLRIDWKKVGVFLVLSFIPIALWGVRNHIQTGHACVTGCSRAAVAWFVRGEQAEHLRGAEPFMCLWAEYVSRDWSNRSEYCSFNAIRHRQWPNGLLDAEDDKNIALGKAGQQKILQYFPWYIWFSVFDLLELHVPFVNGWGHRYNVLVSIAQAFLYLGCLLSISRLKRRELLIPAALVLYCIGIFTLTDATPRYLMPVIFCYVIASAIGYDRLLSRISAWRA